MNYILFDVGANHGQDSLDQTRDNKNIISFVFEPIPELVSKLKHASKFGLGYRYLWEKQEPKSSYEDRYNIFNVAVSDYDGEATFNIADNDPNGDWGASSLYSFKDSVSKEWPGRNDLKTNRVLNVIVTRLDTWYKKQNLNLNKIDYFHCDTQGSDLRVLKGMGDLVYLIEEGVVECARDERAKLYHENHTLSEMKDFLNEKGFQFTGEKRNDPWGNEINLYFKKK